MLVINCINADNETEQRIYEILYNKFDLFKSVLGTGDDVLGTLSKAVNFETRVNIILNKFKTKEQRLHWLQKFEDEITEETKRLKDRKLMETRKLIDELDPNVTKRLKDIQDKLHYKKPLKLKIFLAVQVFLGLALKFLELKE